LTPRWGGSRIPGLRKLLLAALLVFLAAASATAAPVQVVAELVPGQSGPVYDWSLRISTSETAVYAVIVLLKGFDSFTFDPVNPYISLSPDDSFYVDDLTGDGRDSLTISSGRAGLALAPAFSSNEPLGTLHGPANAVGPAWLYDCDLLCGGTVFGLDLAPLQNYTLSVIPEPEPLALLLGGAALALALRTAPRRVA